MIQSLQLSSRLDKPECAKESLESYVPRNKVASYGPTLIKIFMHWQLNPNFELWADFLLCADCRHVSIRGIRNFVSVRSYLEKRNLITLASSIPVLKDSCWCACEKRNQHSFVNISSPVVNDTWIERSSWALQHANSTFIFKNRGSCILTCAELLIISSVRTGPTGVVWCINLYRLIIQPNYWSSARNRLSWSARYDGWFPERSPQEKSLQKKPTWKIPTRKNDHSERCPQGKMLTCITVLKLSLAWVLS